AITAPAILGSNSLNNKSCVPDSAAAHRGSEKHWDGSSSEFLELSTRLSKKTDQLEEKLNSLTTAQALLDPRDREDFPAIRIT
ncbi:Collagen and calcium binding EGF domains 1like, partial [Caligus rogercresseyi]